MISGNKKALAGFIFLSMVPSKLLALDITIPQNRPADERLELKKSVPYRLGFELPVVKKAEILPGQDIRVSSVFVKTIKFTGNTVIKDFKLQDLVKTYLNTRLTQKDLSEIRNNITSYYVNKGYINSGAYIPDQDLTQSILTVAIVEGKLSKINISTTGGLSKDSIRAKLSITVDAILDINDVKNSLYILQQDALIEKINARLLPTDKRGFAELGLDITEKDPFELSILFNNYRPPSVGELQGVLTASNLNLTGEGDTGIFSVAQTEGLKSLDLRYEYPVVPGRFNLGFSIKSNDSDVVEEPFSLIDIQNRSSSWAVQLKYKYYKTLNDELNLLFTLESKTSKTTIGNTSFNLNDVNADETRASIFRFAQEWGRRNIDYAYVVRSIFSLGLNVNSATILDNGADGKYASWLGQFQWLTKLNKTHSASIQLVTQLSNDALLPFEQYAAGGRYSVRGFRENAFIRDLGVTLNLDYKIPYQFKKFDYPVDFVIFSDLSRVKNTERSLASKESIASIGLGVQGRFSKNSGYEVLWAYVAENQPAVVDNALQDNGVHFQFFVRY